MGNGSSIFGGFGDLRCFNFDKMAGSKVSTGVGEVEFRGSRFAARKPTFINSIVALLVGGRILAVMGGHEMTLSVGAQDLSSAMVERASPMVMILSKMFVQFILAFVATLATRDGAIVIAIIGMNMNDVAR
jgi:hypothetical protein